MMREICFALLLPAILGCSRIIPAPLEMPERRQTVPEEEREREEPPVRDSVLACALVYPDGYDWRTDTLGAAVTTDIVLFVEKREILRLTSGDDAGISAQMGLHRLLDGHLYSEYLSPTKTSLFRDGNRLYSFDGRERISSLVVAGDDVLALYAGIGEEKWSYRKNGNILMNEDNSSIVSGLHLDGNEVCFAYRKSLGSVQEDGGGYRFDSVCGSKNETLKYSFDRNGIYSFRSRDGHKDISAGGDDASLVWSLAGKESITRLRGGDVVECATENLVAGEPVLTLLVRRTDGTSTGFYNIVSDSGGELWTTEYGREIYASCGDAPALCFICSPHGGPTGLTLYFNGTETALPQKYAMFSPKALSCGAEEAFIGLNDAEDGYKPVLVRGRDTLKYDFNGFFIDLEYVRTTSR